MAFKWKQNDKPINLIDEFFKLLKKNESIKTFMERPLDRKSFIILSAGVLGIISIWMIMSSLH